MKIDLGFHDGGFFFAQIRDGKQGQVLLETQPGKGLRSLQDLEGFVMPWLDLSQEHRQTLSMAKAKWEKQEKRPFQLLTRPYRWGKQQLRFSNRKMPSFRVLTDLLAHCRMGIQQPWNQHTFNGQALQQALRRHRTPQVPDWKTKDELYQYMDLVQQLVLFYQDQNTGAGHHDQWWGESYLTQLYKKKESPYNMPRAAFSGTEQRFLYLEHEELSEERRQALAEQQAALGWEPCAWDLPDLLQLEAHSSSLLSVLNKNLHPQQRDFLDEQLSEQHPSRQSLLQQQLFEQLLPFFKEGELKQGGGAWPHREAWKRYSLLIIALSDWSTAYPAPSFLQKQDRATRLAYDPWLKFMYLLKGLGQMNARERTAFMQDLWTGQAAAAEQKLLSKTTFLNDAGKAQPYENSRRLYADWASFLAEAPPTRFDGVLLAERRLSSLDRMENPTRYISKLQLMGFAWTNMAFSTLAYQGFVDNLLHARRLADKDKLLRLRRAALLPDSMAQLANRAYGDAAPMRCPFADERFQCACQQGSCNLLRGLRQLPADADCLLAETLGLTA